MLTLHLKGQVTSDGQLLFQLPEKLPPGDVDITIEIPDANEQFVSFVQRCPPDIIVLVPTRWHDNEMYGLRIFQDSGLLFQSEIFL